MSNPDRILLESAPLPGTESHNTEVDARVKQFEQVVDAYSTNRKDRRKFKKLFGVMPPPKNLPYVNEQVTIHESQPKNK